jgi:hypothetical protein
MVTEPASRATEDMKGERSTGEHEGLPRVVRLPYVLARMRGVEIEDTEPASGV